MSALLVDYMTVLVVEHAQFVAVNATVQVQVLLIESLDLTVKHMYSMYIYIDFKKKKTQ